MFFFQIVPPVPNCIMTSMNNVTIGLDNVYGRLGSVYVKITYPKGEDSQYILNISTSDKFVNFNMGFHTMKDLAVIYLTMITTQAIVLHQGPRATSTSDSTKVSDLLVSLRNISKGMWYTAEGSEEYECDE